MSEVREDGVVQGRRGREVRRVRKSRRNEWGRETEGLNLVVEERSKGEDGEPKRALESSRAMRVIRNKTLIGLLELTFCAFLFG